MNSGCDGFDIFYEQSRLLSTPQSTGCGACFCFDEHSCRFLLGFSSCGQLAGVWASNRDRRVWPQEPNSGPCEQICLHRHGALRLAAYLQALDGLVGVESADQRYGRDPKRDYAYAHHALFKKLPVIGKGGGSAFTANPEAILALEPDVIFTGYTPQAAEQLSRETGLPVVCVAYRSLGLVHDSFLTCLQLMADLLGLQPRAKEISNFVENIRQDLKRRTQNIDPRSLPSVYPAAVTFSGSHGFAGTYNRFGPLSAIGARSISDKPGREGFYEADLEFVLKQNPQIIFIDPGNLPIVAEEVKTKPGYFESLQAVQKGRVYAMPSYNQYSTNVSYSLANAYYAGTVLYPKEFADVDFPKKFNEIVSFFNGRGWYDDMAKYGQGYGPISLL